MYVCVLESGERGKACVYIGEREEKGVGMREGRDKGEERKDAYYIIRY